MIGTNFEMVWCKKNIIGHKPSIYLVTTTLQHQMKRDISNNESAFKNPLEYEVPLSYQLMIPPYQTGTDLATN